MTISLIGIPCVMEQLRVETEELRVEINELRMESEHFRLEPTSKVRSCGSFLHDTKRRKNTRKSRVIAIYINGFNAAAK